MTDRLEGRRRTSANKNVSGSVRFALFTYMALNSFGEYAGSIDQMFVEAPEVLMVGHVGNV